MKNNLGNDQTGLAYSVIEAENGSPVVAWEPDPVELELDEVMSSRIGRPPVIRHEVMRWLQESLADGPQLVSEMRAAAEARDFSWETVKRAKDDLGIVAERDGHSRRWLWRLTNTPGQVSGSQLYAHTFDPPSDSLIPHKQADRRSTSAIVGQKSEVRELLAAAVSKATSEGVAITVDELHRNLSSEDLADPQLMTVDCLAKYCGTIADSRL